MQNYSMKNVNGMEIDFINYGGIITSIKVPDKEGNIADVVLGFDDLQDYTKQHPYFGALIGRYGNRISRGKFKLGEKTYILAVNNGPNHLHGGPEGFDKKFWNVEPRAEKNSFLLSYLSVDGEEGYPGTLSVEVIYSLSDENEFKIVYSATTDQPTPVNLTNHTYFNLTGNNKSSVLEHEIIINADEYTVVDEDLSPTGQLRHVKGSEMDFTSAKKIGQDIMKVKEGGGYDHNYVLRFWNTTLRQAATVYEPLSGRLMQVMTTEPGLQFYSGNFLDGTLVGKDHDVYQKHDGFCLETQHFPDSPNHLNFPSTILSSGKIYSSTTIYKFSTR